jgi:L-ascorbate metabolism protein UlaG (beta-lactamase superfamily)
VLQEKGFQHIIEMEPGYSIQIGAVTVKATYAEHHGIRPPFGPLTGCLGYVIHGTQHIYFPGDTDVFQGMSEIANDLDIALLPVWGWGPNLGPGHMNPQRAADALTLLEPRIAIPIHWGTFYPALLGWFRRQLLVDPPLLFKQYAARTRPNVEIIILKPGMLLEI